MFKIQRGVLRGMSASVALVVSMMTFGLFSSQAGAQEAEDGFTTIFSCPPFKEGETVLGIEGWKAANGEAEQNPETVTVESLTNGKGKTGLMLRSYGIDKIISEKLVGQVRVTAVFNFSDFGRGRLMVAPFMGGRIDVISFGYLGDTRLSTPEKFGIAYEVRSSNDDSAPMWKVLVPISELREGQPYTVTADIDFESETFSVSVTGTKADGTALQVSESGISFMGQWKASSLNGLRILGSGTPIETRILLESVSVKPLTL